MLAGSKTEGPATQNRESEVVDRLRANLRAAGIPFDDADVSEVVESGLLRAALALDALDPPAAGDALPDFLAVVEWVDPPASGGASPPAPPAPASAGTLGARGVRSTIARLAPALRAGAVSPVELTEQALERIARRDAELNAFQIVLADQARAAARRAEREIAGGGWRGPLHGVPVAVKDLLALAGTPAAAGSVLLAGAVSSRDAAAVRRLREAGAVIVGKTRMPEFAYSPGSNNPHYGPTATPWDRARDAGGSSSGSGTAVADGMAVAALGTDTGGSIRIPAALCGIVGLKPTWGRVSLAGALPLSWSLDHLGPMTRSVEDAAILLDALAGRDPEDPRTRAAAAGFARALEEPPPALRAGILRSDGSGGPLASPEVMAGVERGVEALRAAGARIEEVHLPELVPLRVASGTILALEAASHHEAALRERSDLLGPFVRRRLLSSYAHGPTAWVRAQQWRAVLRRRLERIFERIDVLALPVVPEVAQPLGVPPPTTHTAPFNALGWPAVSVPVGRAGDWPLAVQLAGRAGDEAAVLRAAALVEARLGTLVSGTEP